MKKLLFVGCSFTKGTGLDGEDKNSKLWTNQVHSLFFPNHALTNLSQVGKNNEWIFLETMTALRKEKFSDVIVAWTSIPRYHMHAGLELYSTHTRLTDDQTDIRLNSGEVFDRAYQQKAGDMLRRMHNDHWHILDLVKYINTLVEVQSLNSSNIWFVNALCPWSDGYFIQKEIKYPSELTHYEQQLLSSDNRDDAEVIALYKKIHSEYNYYGGIQENLWLNLYTSFKSITVDFASPTDSHPGVVSQDIFVENIQQKFLN